MKIGRYARSSSGDHWPYEVSGVGCEGKKFISAGSALAFAQARCMRTGDTFYVREHGDVLYRAEKQGETVVTVFPGIAA